MSTKSGDALCIGLADLFERDAKEVAEKNPRFAKTLLLRAKQLRGAQPKRTTSTIPGGTVRPKKERR